MVKFSAVGESSNQDSPHPLKSALLWTYMYYMSMIWLNYVITTRLFIRPGPELVNCSTNAQEDLGPPLGACKDSSDCQCLKGCLLLLTLSVISPKQLFSFTLCRDCPHLLPSSDTECHPAGPRCPTAAFLSCWKTQLASADSRLSGGRKRVKRQPMN